MGSASIRRDSCSRQSKYTTSSAATMAVGGTTRPKTLASAFHHRAIVAATAGAVNEPDDELLSRPALAVHQQRRIERRHAGREFQDVLHGLASGDEMFRRRMTVDTLPQQVQFPLAAVEQLLTPTPRA